MTIEETVARERAFFRTGKTLPYAYRRDALARLRLSILAHEEDINAALRADLNKSPSESYMCEIGMTLSELSHIQKHLSHWMKKRRAPTPLAQFHAKSFTVANPYGVVLIMSPWNYPFMLTMDPLIGAIAAGNCCVVKPSAYSPAVSAVICTIVSECFPPEYVTVVEGGRAENKALLDQVIPGFHPTPFMAGIITLSLNAGAYLSEIFRSGIQAVPKGQTEAARSLGLSAGRTTVKIVLPQAFKIAIPPMVNQFIITLKDTSILTVIGLAEIVNKATQYVSVRYDYFATYVWVGIFYLVFTSLLMILAHYMEKRLSYDRKGSRS